MSEMNGLMIPFTTQELEDIYDAAAEREADYLDMIRKVVLDDLAR